MPAKTSHPRVACLGYNFLLRVRISSFCCYLMPEQQAMLWLTFGLTEFKLTQACVYWFSFVPSFVCRGGRLSFVRSFSVWSVGRLITCACGSLIHTFAHFFGLVSHNSSRDWLLLYFLSFFYHLNQAQHYFLYK